MLASKVEDMLNTVVRQIAFHEFERRVHDAARKAGELTAERARRGLARDPDREPGAFTFDFWTRPTAASGAYIPHFIHVPFYVYAYAFGDCLVNSLYAVYEQAEATALPRKYHRDAASAGGTKRHKELLAPFGLDASDPDFWSQGLNVIAGFIDELESLE